MKLPPQTLKQILVKSGFIREADFDEAAESAAYLGKKVEDILVFKGFVNEEDLGKLIAEHLKVPFVNISQQVLSEEILKTIPEKLARSYRMVPFEKKDNAVKLAMEDPTNFEALEFARRQTGMQIIPHYATSNSIRKALGQYKKNIRADFEKVIAENVKRAKAEVNLEKAAEKLPVIKVLDTILEYAAAERASDVHIEAFAEEVIIRFRIDGVLHDILKLPRGIENAIVARIKILSNLKIDEHRIPQDGRYKFTVDGDVIGLRISIIPGFYGENVVMRLLPETRRPLSLEELGITGQNLELIEDNIRKPHGMVLATGPTGSGKTTTLYSILNILNTPKVKICTIEDPIEYGIKRIDQIQVNPKVGLKFSTGLRSLLRHDPDIIMVGEIRDKETAEIAIHAALTGHLVLSTLHTNDAAGAIPRFLDMGAEGFLVASTINVVIAQRLVRRICTSCLVETAPSQESLKMLAQDISVKPGQKFYKGKGCDKCHGSGYSGRVGIYEFLAVTDKIRQLVVKRVSSDTIREQAVSEGMITMFEDGMNKIAAGLTTLEEALRAVREK